MRYEKLTSLITTPYFFSYQLPRLFPEESSQSLKMQLTRFSKKGLLIRLKRGIYLFPDRNIDELVLASILYQPSYISLETALHIHGIIPDIPSMVTSVTTITPNLFSTPRGSFAFSKIDRKYYFGFMRIINQTNSLSYNLAQAEKALLDWLYIRKISNIQTHRVNIEVMDRQILHEFSQVYPEWVTKNIL